ncbi:Plasminogen activator inhibitor 1 RNA-binding protein [Saguinus oedipus]|uniref:Plasminogen activator inhibitor 1 RNA-binding protein n=1 Tax=Saguinus oedipus TaxID=9490 RepID=A0ABQ9U6N6_SAGOE|nr:Plasminogen activator inhibitor 1 RNA-binding protein [Saguinus oedipus]
MEEWVTNQLDQLFDNESDPFEVLKAAENKKKEDSGAALGVLGPRAQLRPWRRPAPRRQASSCAESQKDRKDPLPPSVGMVDEKEETQPPVALQKEGIRRVGRRPDQQLRDEGKIIDRRPERGPPRERRFENPLEEKGEGGEFSVDRPIIDQPIRGCGGLGKVEGVMDVKWAEEMDLILVANVNLIGIVEVIDLA